MIEMGSSYHTAVWFRGLSEERLDSLGITQITLNEAHVWLISWGAVVGRTVPANYIPPNLDKHVSSDESVAPSSARIALPIVSQWPQDMAICYRLPTSLHHSRQAGGGLLARIRRWIVRITRIGVESRQESVAVFG
jgi:hypothetical protein